MQLACVLHIYLLPCCTYCAYTLHACCTYNTSILHVCCIHKNWLNATHMPHTCTWGCTHLNTCMQHVCNCYVQHTCSCLCTAYMLHVNNCTQSTYISSYACMACVWCWTNFCVCSMHAIWMYCVCSMHAAYMCNMCRCAHMQYVCCIHA